jgi:hypothetical protein
VSILFDAVHGHFTVSAREGYEPATVADQRNCTGQASQYGRHRVPHRPHRKIIPPLAAHHFQVLNNLLIREMMWMAVETCAQVVNNDSRG